MKKLVFASITLFALKVSAQQTPIYSQYYMNPYLYNPAAAGGNGTRLFFHYRNQWVNIEGSPETYAFTFDGKLKGEQVGLGVTFYNDVSNVISRSNISISSSYTAKLAEAHYLSFGMSVQAIQNKINFDEIRAEDMTDPNLLNSIDQKTAFDMNAGLLYRWKKLRLGIAADQLLQNVINYEDASIFRAFRYQLVRHYISNLSYDFKLNDKFNIQPMLIARIIQGLSAQFDASVIGKYNDIVWSGVGYRHKIGWTFSAGFTIQNQIQLGYTYEIPSSALNQIGGTTHEIVIGWRFHKGNGATSTLSRQDRKYMAKNANSIHSQEIDELKYHNEKISRELEESRELHSAQQNEINQLRDRVSSYEEELDELITSSTRSLELEEDKPEKISRYYVIVSAFKTLEYAKRSQMLIMREQGLETKVIQNDARSFYLVYTHQYEQPDKAIKEAKELNTSGLKDIIVGQPWVYKQDISKDE